MISRLLKIKGLFAKEPYNRDCILQKRPMFLRTLLIIATIFAKMRSTQNVIHIYTFWLMGWLRLVSSIKLQVSFAEYRLFYMALLQKRPVILSILLTVATPYVVIFYQYESFVCCIAQISALGPVDFFVGSHISQNV